MPRKETLINFSDYSGGLNLVDEPINMQPNQVQYGSINAIFQKGIKRAPGTKGLTATNTFSTYLRGLHLYTQFNGTEILHAMSGGKLYSVNKTTEALTELYDLTGTGIACMQDFRSKAWVCNGSEVVKVEGTTAYKVGLSAPSGATAVKAAGGSLAAGDYSVIVGYYRKVSSTIVLYSVGQAAISVTLSAGDLSIAITAPDSADPQVGGAVAWISGPSDGGVYYQYGTSDGTGAYSFTVSSDGAKSLSLIYSVEASNNNRPSAFIWMAFHDNRLWGVDPTDKATIRYSLKAGTDYDLERFPGANTISYPFEVTGLFSFGEHLYVNTKGGLIRQPYGDPSARFEWVDRRYFFAYMNTVDDWGNSVIGMTNDGVRIFDGSTFSPDLSVLIKPEIDKIYGAATYFEPFGIVYRRSDRTEYHLTYQDRTISTTIHNRRLVLDMSRLAIYGADNVLAPWEIWRSSAAYMTVSAANVFYQGQSLNGNSHIFTEDLLTSQDINVYDEKATFITAAKDKKLVVISTQRMPSIAMRCRFHTARSLARLASPATVTVIVGDRMGVSKQNIIGTGTGASRFGIAHFGISRFSSEQPEVFKSKLSANLKGASCYVRIEQAANDPNMNIINLAVEATAESSRLI